MSLRTGLIDALFPDSCLSCFLPRDITWRHEVLCDTCLFSPQIKILLRCSICRVPLRHPLALCHPSRGTIISIETKEPNSMPDLVRALAYQGIARAAYPLSTMLITGLIEAGVPLHKTAITPLPTLSREVRERGYNHHGLITDRISSLMHVLTAPHALTQERNRARPRYRFRESYLPTVKRLLIISAEPLAHHTITALHRAFAREKKNLSLFFVEPTL